MMPFSVEATFTLALILQKSRGAKTTGCGFSTSFKSPKVASSRVQFCNVSPEMCKHSFVISATNITPPVLHILTKRSSAWHANLIWRQYHFMPLIKLSRQRMQTRYASAASDNTNINNGIWHHVMLIFINVTSLTIPLCLGNTSGIFLGLSWCR